MTLLPQPVFLDSYTGFTQSTMIPKPREEKTTAMISVPDGQSKGATRKRANHKIPWSSMGARFSWSSRCDQINPFPPTKAECGVRIPTTACCSAAAWGGLLFLAAINESTFEEAADQLVTGRICQELVTKKRSLDRLPECIVSQNRKYGTW